MLQQFYLSIGSTLPDRQRGRRDVEVDGFLGWQSGGPLTPKIELVCSVEVQR